MRTRDLFERHRLRCTCQRLALYEALKASTDHPTAEELYRVVKPQAGRLSLATVYNTLEALCKVGLARKMPTTNGSCRYDADTNEHSHVRLRETGEIRDLPAELSERLARELPRHIIAEIEQRLGVTIYGAKVQLLARWANRGD